MSDLRCAARTTRDHVLSNGLSEHVEMLGITSVNACKVHHFRTGPENQLNTSTLRHTYVSSQAEANEGHRQTTHSVTNNSFRASLNPTLQRIQI